MANMNYYSVGILGYAVVASEKNHEQSLFTITTPDQGQTLSFSRLSAGRAKVQSTRIRVVPDTRAWAGDSTIEQIGRAPVSFKLTVNGTAYRRMRAPLTEVGVLLDAKAVHTGRSARSHLLALAATHGIGRARVDEVIELTGIGPVAGKRAGKRSRMS